VVIEIVVKSEERQREPILTPRLAVASAGIATGPGQDRLDVALKGYDLLAATAGDMDLGSHISSVYRGDYDRRPIRYRRNDPARTDPGNARILAPIRGGTRQVRVPVAGL
jgi:hypothetical protein